jgi:hypothetical protein
MRPCRCQIAEGKQLQNEVWGLAWLMVESLESRGNYALVLPKNGRLRRLQNGAD